MRTARWAPWAASRALAGLGAEVPHGLQPKRGNKAFNVASILWRRGRECTPVLQNAIPDERPTDAGDRSNRGKLFGVSTEPL